jgi:hypothetical protein
MEIQSLCDTVNQLIISEGIEPAEGSSTYAEVSCNNCNASWHEIWKCVEITDIKKG